MFFSKLVIRVDLIYRSPCSIAIGSKDPTSQASMTQSNTNLDFQVVKIELEPKPGFVKREVFKNVCDIIN